MALWFYSLALSTISKTGGTQIGHLVTRKSFIICGTLASVLLLSKYLVNLKRRWKIVRGGPLEYPIRTQISIIYAVIGLHNFIIA